MVHARRERQIARRQPMAFVQQHFAGAKIESVRADVAAFCRLAFAPRPCRRRAGLFLDDDGVGACGTKPPVKMRAACRHRPGGRTAGPRGLRR